MSDLCDLCRKEKKIQRSHLIPASLYRLARNSKPQKGLGPDPVLLYNKLAIQTPLQVKGSLLCPACEDRFNKYGESIVIRQCLRRDTNEFSLRDRLRALSPHIAFDDSSWYSGARLPNTFRVDAYKYFAASMFWRASAGKWTASGALEWRNTLGSAYQEKFRQFLLLTAQFPREARLVIFVANEEPCHWFISVPCSSRKTGFHVHKFYISGVEFRMFLGRQIEPEILKLFAHLDSDAVFVLGDFRSRPGSNHIAKWVRQSRQKGRLGAFYETQRGA